MRLCLILCAFFLATVGLQHNALAYDEFDEAYAPNNVALHFNDLSLLLKGRMRLALHDLQGEGGPRFDSPTDTQTIGTRSPFIELDSFDLAFRLQWLKTLSLNASVEFLTSGASLSSIYFAYTDYLTPVIEHRAELGYMQPIFATHRHSARYPLIASTNWKNAEYHAAYSLLFHLNHSTLLRLVLAVSMMRPLKSSPLHASPTYKGSFSLISYADAKAFSGNSAAGSALLALQIHNFELEAFGFVGKLSTAQGIDILIADFPHYRLSPQFEPDATSALALLAGARVSFNMLGFHFMAEASYNKLQYLEQLGYYAEGGFTWSRSASWFHSLSLLLRYEQLFLLHSDTPLSSSMALRSPEVSNAISWDYSIATFAIHGKIFREFLSIRLEYALIFEQNEVAALNQRNLDIDNNELLLQLEARF